MDQDLYAHIREARQAINDADQAGFDSDQKANDWLRAKAVALSQLTHAEAVAG